MKKYMVYMESGNDLYKVAVPADSEKKAREYVNGNGDVLLVKDVTEEYYIDAYKVAGTLLDAGFGEKEVDFIVRTLQQTRIAE